MPNPEEQEQGSVDDITGTSEGPPPYVAVWGFFEAWSRRSSRLKVFDLELAQATSLTLFK